MDGVPAQRGFDITAASEVMVILSLSTSLRDMRNRLGRIVVGTTYAGEPVTAEDFKAAGAMAVILKRRDQTQSLADLGEHARPSSTPAPSAT